MGTPEIEVLKSELVKNHSRAEWCTIAVFIGLLIEYTILLWLKRKDLSRIDIALTVIAGIAIAGGVYGEYLFGSKASEAAIKLERISEERVASLNTEAKGLQRRAEEARLEQERLRAANLALRSSNTTQDLGQGKAKGVSHCLPRFLKARTANRGCTVRA